MPISLLPPALLALVGFLGWGIFDRLFEPEAVPEPDHEAVAAAVSAEVEGPRVEGRPLRLHPATAAAYAGDAPAARWQTAAARTQIADLLRDAAADGVGPDEVHAETADRLLRRLAETEASWAALEGEEREALPDPRPARLAEADLVLTDGLFRLGDALRGRRADPEKLYPGTWFAHPRDADGAAFRALVEAVETGRPAAVRRALDGLRPQQDGYRRLRQRLGALQDSLAPIPDGPALRAGEHSVRVPHLRDRLTALGYADGDPRGAWNRPDPYLLDDSLAAALARFEAAHGVEPDSVLDAEATAALNADPDGLRRRLALNLERWRWLPDDLGERFVWVNLPAYELRVLERSDSVATGYAERLRMPANIGNALTTGWTTPVITDSVHTLEFQPAWYVPRSLAAADIFPMARADSLSLWRRGIEAYRNGRPVDTRLVPWDSVSIGEFRFVQRPGPSNPLGRVKFMMHNPYAILIHDTNKRYSFDDGAGSSMSSGCVQAGAPDELAEYLLTTTNGWEPGAARRAWQSGPRRGVRLDRPFLSHFTYFTAWAEPGGALRLYGDPYGYDDRLAEALGLLDPEAEAPPAAS